MNEPSNGYTLYGHPRSGNSYKPALMLSLTDTPFEYREVDLVTGEQLGDAHRTRSLFATLPVLTTARSLSASRTPRSCTSRAVPGVSAAPVPNTGYASASGCSGSRISSSWASAAAVSSARWSRVSRPCSSGSPRWATGPSTLSRPSLPRASSSPGAEPTIADIACYAYARLAEEGEFDMHGRPATVAWRERIEGLSGWAPPSGLLTAGP